MKPAFIYKHLIFFIAFLLFISSQANAQVTGFGGPLNEPYVKISDTQSSGTGGGQATTGSWQDEPLNTKDFDTGSIATLSSYQITLPAGTYQVQGEAPFRRTGNIQVRLYNVTSSSVILNGMSGNADTGSNSNPVLNVVGQFTLTSSSTVVFQYQASVSQSSNQDLGIPASYGTEVYAQIEFWKIA